MHFSPIKQRLSIFLVLLLSTRKVLVIMRAVFVVTYSLPTNISRQWEVRGECKRVKQCKWNGPWYYYSNRKSILTSSLLVTFNTKHCWCMFLLIVQVFSLFPYFFFIYIFSSRKSKKYYPNWYNNGEKELNSEALIGDIYLVLDNWLLELISVSSFKPISFIFN